MATKNERGFRDQARDGDEEHFTVIQQVAKTTRTRIQMTILQASSESYLNRAANVLQLDGPSHLKGEG